MAAFKRTLKTYYYLTKPGIIYGNLLTAAGGFLFAASGNVNVRTLVGVLAGEALVIASGCVYNNVLDRSLDRKMQRTHHRATARGTVSTSAALLYASVLAIAGLITLAQTTNQLTTLLGLFALFAYVVLYGIGKRRTIWGTLIGTISGALPPIGGYTAVTGRLDSSAALIFLILVTWQMAHFYAIAIYRLDDYQSAGLPVWPARRGIVSTRQQVLFFISLFLLACAGLTIIGEAGYSFLGVMALLAVAWLIRSLRNIETFGQTAWARQVFIDSLFVILALSVMLSVGLVLP